MMDLNGRMSHQFRLQGQANGARGQKQQQQNDSDAFMRLVSRNTVFHAS